jgi:hypothetical protein
MAPAVVLWHCLFDPLVGTRSFNLIHVLECR